MAKATKSTKKGGGKNRKRRSTEDDDSIVGYVAGGAALAIGAIGYAFGYRAGLDVARYLRSPLL